MNKAPKLALGRIANCAYCASMGWVVIPILSVVVAAAVAILSGIIAHDSFGIATDTIRSDALRSAGCREIKMGEQLEDREVFKRFAKPVSNLTTIG